MHDECFPCQWNALLDELAPRECVVVHEGWRIAHAFNTSLPGWLVLVPLRHVESIAQLTPGETVAFAELARTASIALVDAVGCAKTYLVVLGEEKGFAHLHAHVVPRMPDVPDDLKGTHVFRLLGGAQEHWLSEDERDQLALELRERIGAELTGAR